MGDRPSPGVWAAARTPGAGKGRDRVLRASRRRAAPLWVPGLQDCRVVNRHCSKPPSVGGYLLQQPREADSRDYIDQPNSILYEKSKWQHLLKSAPSQEIPDPDTRFMQADASCEVPVACFTGSWRARRGTGRSGGHGGSSPSCC